MTRRSGFVGFIPAAADGLAAEQASTARQRRLEARYEEAHAAAERARAAAQRSAAAVEAARRVPTGPIARSGGSCGRTAARRPDPRRSRSGVQAAAPRGRRLPEAHLIP